MKCNIGQVEKYVRLVLGLVLFALGHYLQYNVTVSAGYFVIFLSVIFLLTGIFSWCPVAWWRSRSQIPQS